jgi:hypothetical protein
MSAQIIQLRSQFDPLAPGAEAQYDRLVHRLNQLAATRNRNRKLRGELERQFIENDLTAVSGQRRGQPLTPQGRRRRLSRLLVINDDINEIESERSRLGAELERMNEALEAWARETYGLGDAPASGSEEQG